MKKLIILALAISALSSAAYAGSSHLDGIVRDQNGDPLAGVLVKNYASSVDPSGQLPNEMLTDANGHYDIYMETGSGGLNAVFLWKESYSQPVRLAEDSYEYHAQDWKMTNLNGAFAPVYDNFNGGPGLGTTDDPAHYAWGQMGAGATVTGGSLVVNSGNAAAITSNGDGEYFAPGNFDMTTSFKPGAGFAWNVITYRLGVGGSVGDYNTAETIFFGPDGGIVGNAYAYPTSARTYRTATAIDWNVFHKVRLQVNGYKARLWWDDVLVADQFNTNPEARYDGYPYPAYPDKPDYLNAEVYTGFVGFQAFGGTMSVDYVNIGSVPEPGSIAVLLTGIVGLVGFARRRRA